jgi:anti-sigma factor RsiW
MNCEGYRQVLSEYLDEELVDPSPDEVRCHLSQCPDCRDECETLSRIIDATVDLPRHIPDEETVLAISRLIHQSTSTNRNTQFGPVLDAPELVDFLRIDAKTLEAYIGEIPCFEMGGKLLFRRKSVEDWIRRKETRIGLHIDESLPGRMPVMLEV